MCSHHTLVCPCCEVLATGSELPLCLSSPSTWGAGASPLLPWSLAQRLTRTGGLMAPHTCQMRQIERSCVCPPV